MQGGPWAQPFYPIPPGAYVGEARFPEAKRPGWATAAGIILIIGGSFVGLCVLPILIGGLMAPDGWLVAGSVGSIWAAGQLAAGIGILRRRSWARMLGTVLSVLGALLGILVIALLLLTIPFFGEPAFLEEVERDPELIELYGAGNVGAAMEQTMVLAVVFLCVMLGGAVVAYLCALYGVIRSSAYFAWRPPPGGLPTRSVPGGT